MNEELDLGIGHDGCYWNCGGTECHAPARVTATSNERPRMIWALVNKEWRQVAVKDQAIDVIKAQPFYAANA